jgi:hypothetical protein
VASLALTRPDSPGPRADPGAHQRHRRRAAARSARVAVQGVRHPGSSPACEPRAHGAMRRCQRSRRTLTRKARRWEPKRLRLRLFAVAGRLTRGSRRLRLRHAGSWPWAAGTLLRSPACRTFRPADQAEQPSRRGRESDQGPVEPARPARHPARLNVEISPGHRLSPPPHERERWRPIS